MCCCCCCCVLALTSLLVSPTQTQEIPLCRSDFCVVLRSAACLTPTGHKGARCFPKMLLLLRCLRFPFLLSTNLDRRNYRRIPDLLSALSPAAHAAPPSAAASGPIRPTTWRIAREMTQARTLCFRALRVLLQQSMLTFCLKVDRRCLALPCAICRASAG
jgi:hypothetical protein